MCYNGSGENMWSIQEKVVNKIIIKNSRFITFLYPVFNVDDVTKILSSLKQEYNDANHICYAYIIDGKIKSSDNKEPSGTAGVPILNVLEKNNLNMVLAVVIRYFGGIKLGAGGLVRAYSNSVSDCLNLANIIELIDGFLVSITFDYDNTKIIDNILKNYKIIDKNYNDLINYKFECFKDHLDTINDILKDYIVSFNYKEKYIQKDSE